MKRLLTAVLLFGVVLPARAGLTADQILARTDEIRFPSGDSSVQATVTSKKPGRSVEDKAVYEVWIKGRDRTLIKTLSPATDRGTSILMVDKDLWVYLPDVSKPLRISLQQRLLGDVSNGDLARANFVGDYKPTLVESHRTFYVLLLKARSEDVTYGSIKLWIDRPSYRPLKAAFYAASGRILKVGSYEDFKPMAGGIHPSRVVFTDALVKGQKSTIHYSDIAPRNDLADKYFTKDYLKKLKY